MYIAKISTGHLLWQKDISLEKNISWQLETSLRNSCKQNCSQYTRTMFSILWDIFLHTQHNGREFDNAIFRDLRNLFDINITLATAGHLQINGTLERFYPTSLDMTKMYISAHLGEHLLNIFASAIAYNKSKNEICDFKPFDVLQATPET